MRFLVITDHHLGRDRYTFNRGYSTAWALDRVLDAIGSAGAHGADFLLCTGDLVDSGNSEEYDFARSRFGIEAAGIAPGPLRITRRGLAGMPFYIIPGNHDPRDVWLDNLFPASPIERHLDLHWRVNKIAFAYLDLGSDGRAGILREASLQTLDRLLEQGAPTILVLHHHPVPVGIPWLDRALPAGIDRLWDRLKGGRVRAVLFGHAHTSVDQRIHGVPVLGTRSTCFQFASSEQPTFVIQPLQYRLIEIDDDGLHTQLYEVPLTGTAKASAVT
ncbi:MAG: metallophosphoesterase [Trueperaceae bacterium]